MLSPALIAPALVALSVAQEPDLESVQLEQTQRDLAAAIERLDVAEQRIRVLETEIALSEVQGEVADEALGEPLEAGEEHLIFSGAAIEPILSSYDRVLFEVDTEDLVEECDESNNSAVIELPD